MKREELLNRLMTLNACNEGVSDIAEAEYFPEKMHKYLDFCIINDVPTVGELEEHIRQEGEAEKMHESGIYVSESLFLVNPDRVIINGESNGHIIITNGCSANIWVRHGSVVTVNISQGGVAMIRCTDKASVKVNCGPFSTATVIRYDDTVKITKNGDVLVRNRINFYKKNKNNP